MVEIRIPRYSYAKGWVDEGISDALGNPPGFRYSERFLRKWYCDEDDIETGNKFAKGFLIALGLAALFWVAVVFILVRWIL